MTKKDQKCSYCGKSHEMEGETVCDNVHDIFNPDKEIEDLKNKGEALKKELNNFYLVAQFMSYHNNLFKEIDRVKGEIRIVKDLLIQKCNQQRPAV